MTTETFIIYNLLDNNEPAEDTIQKYNYWKVYNVLKSAGFKVWYKPADADDARLSPKRIPENLDVSTVKLVYFAGNAAAFSKARELLAKEGLIREGNKLYGAHSLTDKMELIRQGSRTKKGNNPEGDWDDNIDNFNRGPGARRRAEERRRHSTLYSRVLTQVQARLEKL